MKTKIIDRAKIQSVGVKLKKLKRHVNRKNSTSSFETLNDVSHLYLFQFSKRPILNIRQTRFSEVSKPHCFHEALGKQAETIDSILDFLFQGSRVIGLSQACAANCLWSGPSLSRSYGTGERAQNCTEREFAWGRGWEEFRQTKIPLHSNSKIAVSKGTTTLK